MAKRHTRCPATPDLWGDTFALPPTKPVRPKKPKRAISHPRLADIVRPKGAPTRAKAQKLFQQPDLLTPNRLHPSLNNIKPIFAEILSEYNGIETIDTRPPYLRYLEDAVQQIAYTQPKNKPLQQVTKGALQAYRAFQQIKCLQRELAEASNRKIMLEEILAAGNQELGVLAANLIEGIHAVRQNMAKLKGRTSVEIAMILELVYMPFFGSKPTLITINNSKYAPYYHFKKEYIWLWRDEYPLNSDELEEDEQFSPEDTEGLFKNHPDAWSWKGFWRKPRPIWWAAMELREFSKLVRAVVPLTKEEKAKRFYSPVMCRYWRDNPKVKKAFAPPI